MSESNPAKTYRDFGEGGMTVEYTYQAWEYLRLSSSLATPLAWSGREPARDFETEEDQYPNFLVALNILGDEGWIAFAATGEGQKYNVLLKRPKAKAKS